MPEDRRTLARLYTLVNKTDQAGEVLQQGENLLALLSAYMAARAAKRPRKAVGAMTQALTRR